MNLKAHLTTQTERPNSTAKYGINEQELVTFIVEAKLNSYVGDGKVCASCRKGSHDIGFEKNQWSYLDSYFGGTDLIGQEVVWNFNNPVWAMNYCGRILAPELINAEKAGTAIKTALAEMYRSGRFLGGFKKKTIHGYYNDHSTGDVASFSGVEKILVEDVVAYQLDYAGGLVVP